MPLTPTLAAGDGLMAPTQPSGSVAALKPAQVPAVTTAGPSAGRKTTRLPPVDEYRFLVDRVLNDVTSGRTPTRAFDNFDHSHAGAVVEAMLSRATSFVHVFAQRLSNDVFSIDLLQEFLDRCPDGRIEIVVEDAGVLADPYSALFGASEFVSNSRVYVGVYKPPFPREKAVAIVKEGRDKHFDPDMVDAFLQIEEEFHAIASRFADSEADVEKVARA